MNKKEVIVISSFICLLPILIGGLLWNLLPESLASHIGLLGIDGFISKRIVILLLPLVFLLIHFVVVFKPDWINSPGTEKRYWYIPVISSIFFSIAFILSFATS